MQVFQAGLSEGVRAAINEVHFRYRKCHRSEVGFFWWCFLLDFKVTYMFNSF